MIWRRHDADERVQLAEDARRVAGFADALVDKATRRDGWPSGRGAAKQASYAALPRADRGGGPDITGRSHSGLLPNPWTPTTS